MAFLLGHLGHPPAVAWGMTLIEYDAAWRGYASRRGVNVDAPRPMTRRRMAELLTQYPDAPNG